MKGYGDYDMRDALSAIGLVALFLVIVLGLATSAAASERNQYQKQDQDQKQMQSNENNLAASSSATATAAGGDGGSSGDMVSMNSSQFYALSLMFPNASDCFTGAQGGAQDSGANSGTSAFLGFHILNTSCWLDKLAGEEQDINLNARLKCGDKKYRNAIAYDVPKKERQSTCISMKVASGMALMNQHTDQLQRALDQANANKATLIDLRAIDNAECDEKIERCEARLGADK